MLQNIVAIVREVLTLLLTTAMEFEGRYVYDIYISSPNPFIVRGSQRKPGFEPFEYGKSDFE